MTVLTVDQADDLAARTLAEVDRRGEEWNDADRERVTSDLAGLRQHSAGEPWCDCGTWDTTVHGEPDYEVCDDARRYSDGLLRTAALYAVTP